MRRIHLSDLIAIDSPVVGSAQYISLLTLPGPQGSVPVMSEVPEAGRRTGRQSCQSCGLFLAGLAVLFLVYFVYSMRAPMWNAGRLKARLHVGMSAGEVVGASLRTGRHLVFVSPPIEGGTWYFDDRGVTVGNEHTTEPGAARALVDKQMAGGLQGHTLSFLYLSAVPVRASVRVTFDGTGHVSAIEGPAGHAD
jgi:hypothetical protein